MVHLCPKCAFKKTKDSPSCTADILKTCPKVATSESRHLHWLIVYSDEVIVAFVEVDVRTRARVIEEARGLSEVVERVR